MNSPRTDNRVAALIVAFLAVLGIGLVAIKPNFTRFLLGSVLCVAADSHRIRNKLTYADVVSATRDAFDQGGESLNHEFAPLSGAIAQTKLKVQTKVFEQLPLAQQLAKRMEMGNALRTNGLELFADAKSGLLLGDTGDGKTRLLNWLIARYLHNHSDGELLIGDIDYGSAHAGADPNTWMGLPVGNVVIIEPEEIYKAILSTANEVEHRATQTRRAIAAQESAPDFQPKLLVVDEWITFFDDLTSKQQESVTSALNKIAVRGVKQRIYCFLACHDASVKSLGISQAKLARWNVLALYKWICQAKTTDATNLPQGFDKAAEKAKAIPRQVGSSYTAIAYVGDKWQLVGIPEIEPSKQIEILPTDERLKIEVLAQLQQHPIEAIDSYRKACTALGITNRRSDNPQYQAVVAAVDELKANPEILSSENPSPP